MEDKITDNIKLNLITFTKYKYLILLKYKKKNEIINISKTDNLNLLTSNLIYNNPHIQITINEDKNTEGMTFHYILYFNNLYKNINNNIINLYDDIIKKINKNTDYDSPIFITSDTKTVNLKNDIIIGKHNHKIYNTLYLMEISVNINSILQEEIIMINKDEYNKLEKIYSKLKLSIVKNLDTDIFTKLFYIIDNLMYGLKYIYSNPCTSKSIEYRFI